MENALAPAPKSLDPRILAACEARRAYEDAIDSDGVSATAWRALSERMTDALDGLRAIGALPGVIESMRARAVDAGFRAQYAERMVEVARRTRPIDMSSLISA